MNKFGRVLFLTGLAVFLPLVPALAADEKQAETKPVDAGGVRLPWHTTDVRWRGSRTIDDVETIGVTFTVDRDVPDTVNLYISPMGGQYLNKIVFYGGIQSNVNGWPSPTEERRVHPGPGAIFSRWGGEPVSIDAARPEEGGLCESAGYEGEFVSVRKPYRWKAGTYTWEIRKESTEEIDGEPHTWFACYLIEHDGEKEIRVGALRFEGETFSFNGHSTSFVEIYATAKIPRSEVPEVSVVFQPPVVNGEPLLPSAVSIYHPRQGDKGSPSPPLGRAEAVDGGVKVNLYNEVLQGDEVPPNRYNLEVPLRSQQS
jgi:hypothetical protein